MAKLYLKSHEWLNEENGTIGISKVAADALGDIVFVELPEEGDEVVIGEAFCTVESVKAVSEIFSPVTGKIIQVNEELIDNPEIINEDAENIWLIKVEILSKSDELMDKESYNKLG